MLRLRYSVPLPQGGRMEVWWRKDAASKTHVQLLRLVARPHPGVALQGTFVLR